MRFVAWLMLLLVILMPASAEAMGAPAMGGRVALVRDGNLWLWDGGQERQLTQEGKVERPSFSADGENVLYFRSGGARYVSVLRGGTSWALPDGGTSWSPTEPMLGLFGGILTTRVTPHGPLKAKRTVFGGWAFGEWAPDGRRVAVLRGELPCIWTATNWL